MTNVDIRLLRDKIEKNPRYGREPWLALEEIAALATTIAQQKRPASTVGKASVQATQLRLERATAAAIELAAAIEDLGKHDRHLWLDGTIAGDDYFSQRGAAHLRAAAGRLSEPSRAILAVEKAASGGRSTAAFRVAVHLIAHWSPDIHRRFLRARTGGTSVYMPEDIKRALCALTNADINSVKQLVKTSWPENVVGLVR